MTPVGSNDELREVSRRAFGSFLKKHPLAEPDGFRMCGSIIQTEWFEEADVPVTYLNGTVEQVRLWGLIARRSDTGHERVYEIG